ncbi:hypothetical protein AB0M12_16070 [Nocardia vinacea]
MADECGDEFAGGGAGGLADGAAGRLGVPARGDVDSSTVLAYSVSHRSG